MKIAQLPPLSFVGADGETEYLALSKEAGRVSHLANFISRRFQSGDAIGLIFRSSPELAVWWLACIYAGMRPLVIQFPNAKQAFTYWKSSVQHATVSAGLKGLICDEAIRGHLEGIDARVECQPLSPRVHFDGDIEFSDFSIIQLSSGTTGHRKAVEFTSDALRRHAADYNKVLKLSADDMIVSWLPLYHDMGYIACFVMPLLLGVPVTMIDPEDWVRNRRLLFHAIEAHRGTVCYMPNFGFEVMSALAPANLSTMRLWISCSEPVKPATVRKFLKATGTSESRFAVCYAMAENIFAVSQSSGLITQDIDGVEVASCGPSIPDVELKILDDEIWVRSPTSIDRYIGGSQISDNLGFYPTGDLGKIVDGELYVSGRKRDLMIQAGKKFMLSDVDAVVNALVPGARGRAATLAGFDARLGTQRPIVLIETDEFFRTGSGQSISEKILNLTGLDNVEVQFVPPKFLTKTSSGKINRVISLEHWNAVQERSSVKSGDWREAIEQEFGMCDFDAPVSEILDSLSMTVLRLILSEAEIELDESQTLHHYTRRQLQVSRPALKRDVIRVVSLADRRIFRRLSEQHIRKISERVGAPIVFEHLCLPPAPILLSDMVFAKYFGDRLPDPSALSSVRRAFDKLREASVIIMDDAAEFHFPVTQVYPVISHRLERSEKADFLAYRWQRYADQHHLLPVAVVAGSDLPLTGRDQSIGALCEYVDAQAFRIASTTAFEAYTQDWEMRELHTLTGGPGLPALNPGRFITRFASWLSQRKDQVRRFQSSEHTNALDLNDLAHFCSHYVNKGALEKVLDRFDRFCIAGRQSSVSYIPKRLEQLGKSFFYVQSYAPQILERAGAFDCLLVCGPMGKFDVRAPAVPVMSTNWDGDGALPKNMGDADIKNLRLRSFPKSDPSSEWFAPFGNTLGSNTAEELYRLRSVNWDQVKRAEVNREAARQRAELRQQTLDKAAALSSEDLREQD